MQKLKTEICLIKIGDNLVTKGLAITNDVNDKIDDIVAKHKVLRKEGFVNALLKLSLWNDITVKQAITNAYSEGNLGATATENKP
jgi:hypothetical protein